MALFKQMTIVGVGLIGGSLAALNPLALGAQASSTGVNGGGIKVVKLTNAKMPAASWNEPDSRETASPGVKSCAGPSAAMTMSSSQRIPNSPGM